MTTIALFRSLFPAPPCKDPLRYPLEHLEDALAALERGDPIEARSLINDAIEEINLTRNDNKEGERDG